MSDPESPAGPSPQILTCDDGTVLAYYKTETGKASTEETPASPGLIFLGGFMSDMTGTKALTLEAFAQSRGLGFLRFDYRGHGASPGRFEDGTIGGWLADTLAVLDSLAEGPQILIGSSMGGWMAMLAALARPERVAGLLGIAAAPDFTEYLIQARTTAALREQMARDGYVLYPSAYSEEPYVITMRLIEEAREHLLFGKPIPITCPVRLVQGMKDPDVPWQTTLKLCEALESEDVELTLLKSAGHRLSEPDELALILRTLEALIDRCSAG